MPTGMATARMYACAGAASAGRLSFLSIGAVAMRSRMLSTLGLAVAFVWGAAVMGGDAAAAQTLRFCFNEWRPYSYVENGEPRGISLEIARQAAARAGFDATFEQLPWNRCLDAVESGKDMDAVIDAAARPELVQGPTATNIYTNTFWVRDDSPVDQYSKQVLNGRKIGLVYGYTYPDTLEHDIADAGMTVEYAKDDLANVRLLVAGRVDFIIGDYVSTHVIATRQGYAVRPLHPNHSADRLYISFGRSAAAEQLRFDDALSAMMAEGVIDRIYDERLGIALSDLLGK